jgi:hypothetical protein
MGKKTIYIDDIDGTDLDENAKPVRFSLDGKNYSIYLSEDNKAKLVKALDPFVSKAEVVTGSGSSSSGASNSNKDELKKVRAWAQSSGYKFRAADGTMKSLGSKGRIPEEVITAYHEAND